MPSLILRRLPARPSSSHLLYSTLPRSFTPATTLLTSRSSPLRHLSTTKGDTPNASNVSNPQSGSTEQSDIKTSRATDSTPSPDSASTQTPVSGENMQKGKTEDPDDDGGKRDPSKPAEEKREEVLKQGEKPLGPEDHQ